MQQQTGTLAVWKADRGYGFIKRHDGPDVFVHIRDFGRIPRQPREGDIIHFQPLPDKQGRFRAADVRIEGLNASASPAGKSARFSPSKHRRKPAHQSRRLPIKWGLAAAIIAGLLSTAYQSLPNTVPATATENVQSTGNDSVIQRAYRQQQSDLQVRGSGIVSNILPDDRQGSQHQRFILRLPSNITVLVAHNIDLAPRINGLQVGDTVAFNGEYEWNKKGGVIHWTHHDPSGRHTDGWLEHRGQRYR
ncbi:DUF3465 domain-containing protein [Amphritea opalescens]|uniref:DUF3465 domain-containing protein n=1 Tax=Amphritea opalescens TaxID=2490544 RepID=A0A430KWB0_9GAMM|nr:DUF3465 domain-containing protein [Amphritea opalescens]RTE67746.1 DUF3465 domain-containing protein [Amphritea opalescens]